MKKLISVTLILVLVLSLGATAFADSGITVTKSPTDEVRSAGNTAWFVSGAYGYSSLNWKFMTPGGEFFSVQDFRSRFPYASVEGEYTTTLTIRNLGTEMNGLGVLCSFSGNGGAVDAQMAFLYVSPCYSAPVYTEPTTPASSTLFYVPDGTSFGGYGYDENGNLEYDVYYEDGHYTTFYSDGSSYTDFLNGSYMVEGRDGSFVIYGNDGSYREYDGTGNWNAYDAANDSYTGGVIYN